MSRNVSEPAKARPSALATKSFTRYEPPNTTSPTSSRSRASTVQAVPTKKVDASPEDIFEKSIDEEAEPSSPDLGRSGTLPDRFDELPIELASLCDRFVDSLGNKVYNEPPTIDQLSELFQEFYARAAGAVSIHIATLRSRLNRENSPTPSKNTSRSRAPTSKPSVDSLGSGTGRGQQMLTASEVTERRKQRKLLEYKRVVLEEAVEKRVCERIYEKIWRHKSTLDEVRDEKLRSKTAALALVGIGLKDLGIELGSDAAMSAEDVQVSLAPARESLAKMNEERYPLGKLVHLTTAHKAVVDTLSSVHSSSSSADEILPTLIYTLITSPIEGINVISNLQFIQRFRASPKVDGEAAYCLTNLEAAITFLEDVDLASLRADEKPEGPTKTATQHDVRPGENEKLEAFPTLPGTVPLPSTPTTASSTYNAVNEGELSPAASILRELPEKTAKRPATRHQRTLSDLLQPITNANEAVRSTAEEGFKNISNTLDNSVKFFLGKLKERGKDGPNTEVVVPKTLDEARQLVSRPLTPEEDDHAFSESSSVNDGQTSPMPSNLSKTEEKLLGLLGGRKAVVRERSVDSVQSNSSAGGGRRLPFMSGPTSTSSPDAAAGNAPLPTPAATTQKSLSVPAPATSSNPLETVKSFGSSINPMGSIGSAFGNAFGRFGGARPSASPPAVPAVPSIHLDPGKAKDTRTVVPPANDSAMRTPDKAELAAIRSAPPIPRFLLLGDAKELRLGEVQDLLDDYQRLARVLGKLVQRAQNEDEDTADDGTEAEDDKDKVLEQAKG
jgi:hypothetical protein